MIGRDTPSLWVAASLLLAGAVAILWLERSAPARPACALPASPDALASLSTADVREDRSAADGHGNIALLEGHWRPPGYNVAWSTVQLVVSTELSEFVVPPHAIMPDLPLPTDQLELRELAAGGRSVPFHLRTSRSPVMPFVLGWIYALEGEAIDSPLDALTRRAFARPFEPAPPITLLTADSKRGSVPAEQRASLVTRRLDALWREWEASCRS